MMNKLKLFLIPLIGILVLNACSSSDIIFEDKKDFNEQKWMRFEVDTFQFEVKNIEDCYDLFLQCRFTPEISIEEIPMIIKMHAPSGQMRNFIYNLPIKNKNGNIEGDKIGAIYESERKMRKNLFFNEKGDYIISIQQLSSQYEIFNILGIGLTIKKCNLDYTIKD